MSSQPPMLETSLGVQLDALFHFLLRHIPDRIYFKDSQSRFLWVSDAMARFLGGKGPEDLLGKTDFDFFTDEHAQQAFEDEQAVMRSGEPMIGRIEKETLPDGRIGWALTTKIPMRDPSGRVVGTCGISRDFTTQKALEDSLEKTNAELARNQAELERALSELTQTHAALKTAQADLVEAEKIRAQARFVSGIAHEIRNPLNIVNMAVEYLKGQADVPPQILSTMQDAILQADAVISALMDATDDTGLRLEPCDMVPVVESAIGAFSEPFRGGVELVRSFDPSLPLVAMDRDKLGHCVRGLFQNAIDAMGGAGRLDVKILRRPLSEEDVPRDSGSRSAQRLKAGEDAVVLEILDSGPGIPAEALRNLFDPFYTTKATGKGTGLGLTVCRKIVELHHGLIRVRNREEGGLRVTILLPIADRKE